MITSQGIMVAVLATLIFVVSSASKTTYCFDNYVVTIHGRFDIKHRHGPPGYGETPKIDRNVSVYVVIPDEPFDIRGDDYYDDIYNVKIVQIYADAGISSNIRRGSCIAAIGRLEPQLTAGDFFRVTLSATSVRLSKECRAGVQSQDVSR